LVRTFHWLGSQPFTSVAKGAFTKLKAIYPQLNTTTAKTIAEERQRETKTLLESLEKEFSLVDLQLS